MLALPGQDSCEGLCLLVENEDLISRNKGIQKFMAGITELIGIKGLTYQMNPSRYNHIGVNTTIFQYKNNSKNERDAIILTKTVIQYNPDSVFQELESKVQDITVFYTEGVGEEIRTRLKNYLTSTNGSK